MTNLHDGGDLPAFLYAGPDFTWEEDITLLTEEREFALSEWRAAEDDVSRALWHRLYDHLDWAIGTLRVLREVCLHEADEDVDLEALASDPAKRPYLLGQADATLN